MGNFLAEEIVKMILLNLPVKSLLVCKSVCKLWLSIISNSSFIKSQLQRAHTMNSTLLIIIKAGEPNNEPQQQKLDKLNCPVHLDYLIMPRPFEIYDIIGCYNGIICLSSWWGLSSDNLHLWNPSIGKYKKLPDYHNRFSVSCLSMVRDKPSPYRTGFGYDSISDDYKVIRILDELSYRYFVVQMYSVNADSWTQFQSSVVKKRFSIQSEKIVVNKVLYFNNDEELIAFDLHNQVLGLVPLPSFIQERDSKFMDFEGLVAILCKSGPVNYHLWTLDGVFWTQNFNIHTDMEYLLLGLLSMPNSTLV
ncbi:F-box/kelch-repeat protein At3g23880-like [Apium graveolens]|uniref:F-box/kelch-repeat protein At3g23880-like n=1 Tax=Apium graveolens TaxID=4045 RepID=UPI003D78F7CE